jgi:deoxyadenosine/deoxycytidine kinase
MPNKEMKKRVKKNGRKGEKKNNNKNTNIFSQDCNFIHRRKVYFFPAF